MNSITEKKCSKCGEIVDISLFTKNRAKKSGLGSVCKKCNNKDSKKYREDNPEKRKEQEIKGSRKWRENNPEKVKEYSREYREKNIEIEKEKERQWRINNPKKKSILNAIRRALLRGSTGKFTHNEWIALCERYNNKCVCCGETKELTIDHVIPLSKGGRNDIDNIQPLCKSCNSSKKDKTIDYRRRLG